MGLNKQKGNMYAHVTHTWNVIKGKCAHDCIYCYMKVFKLGELKFDKKELTTPLGKNNFIFVGSSTDMFAKNVPSRWIDDTLSYCRKFQNRYLFQSKNPVRFFQTKFPLHSLLCVTIESNREYPEISKAPSNMFERAECIRELRLRGFETQITIEPVLDFDFDDFVDLLIYANPTYFVIGADSKGHHLPEPTGEQVKALLASLKTIHGCEVIEKSNLGRLLNAKRSCKKN